MHLIKSHYIGILDAKYKILGCRDPRYKHDEQQCCKSLNNITKKDLKLFESFRKVKKF